MELRPLRTLDLSATTPAMLPLLTQYTVIGWAHLTQQFIAGDPMLKIVGDW